MPVRLLVDLMLQQEPRDGRRPDYRRACQPRVAASLRDQPASAISQPRPWPLRGRRNGVPHGRWRIGVARTPAISHPPRGTDHTRKKSHAGTLVHSRHRHVAALAAGCGRAVASIHRPSYRPAAGAYGPWPASTGQLPAATGLTGTRAGRGQYPPAGYGRAAGKPTDQPGEHRRAADRHRGAERDTGGPHRGEEAELKSGRAKPGSCRLDFRRDASARSPPDSADPGRRRC